MILDCSVRVCFPGSCADCMQPPTDLEYGFDEHAPPRRPAARPSVGPGSQYCCVGPALADALPKDFPLDLIPLTHSYLLSDSPSRSFLTTAPLPAQGTIQCMIVKTNTKFELYMEMKNQTDFIAMRAQKEAKEQERRKKEEARARKAAGLPELVNEVEEKKEGEPAAPGIIVYGNVAGAAAEAAAAEPSLTAIPATATSSAAASPALGPMQPPTFAHSHSMPPAIPVVSLDDSEVGLSSEMPDPLPLETPDVTSPTHCVDYEKLFPERPPQPVARRTRSATNTPLLQPQQAPPAALDALHRQMNSGRRMSEPACFSLGPGLASSGSNDTSVNNSPRMRRRVLQPPHAASANSTPAGFNRRLLGAAPPASSASASASAYPSLPPSASNLHLHQTRSNAINRMLKEHAEAIIAEGKDIFLLCAQRKRSFTGNHYLISSSRDDIRADGPHFLGKLKSNFGGTVFEATDNGTRTPNKKTLETLPRHMYPTIGHGLGVASRAATPTSNTSATSALANWLTGSHRSSSPQLSFSQAAVPHVRHELACVLYDHFFEHSGK
jgi:hypothetical protein